MLYDVFTFQFPAFVRPEPVGRVASDGLLQPSGEAFGYLAVGSLLGRFGDQVEDNPAVSPLLAYQFAVEDGKAHHPGNTFGSVHEHGVLMEERSPVVRFAAVGRLVGNQSHGHALVFAAQLYHFARRGVFGHVVSAEARADALEHFVQVGIVQRFIDLYRKVAGLHDSSHADNPFEVGIVGDEEYDAAMFFNHVEVLLLVLVGHAPGQLFEGYSQGFHFFEDVVADVVVELVFYLFQLFARLFGKRVPQVGAYHLPTVADDVLHQEGQSVGQDVDGSERQQGQQPHSGIGEQIDKFRFHGGMIVLFL